MFQPGDHVADMVDAFLHDLVTAEQQTHIAAHCASCESCDTALQQARQRRALLDSVPTSEASEELIQRTLQRVAAGEERRRRFRNRAIIALLSAAALVIAGVGIFHFFYMRGLKVTPYDLQVLGQQQLFAGTMGSMRVELLNHQTGKPLSGVPVTMTLRDRTSGKSAKLTGFTTDDSGAGQPRFTLPDWPEGSYDLTVSADTPSAPEINTQSIKLVRAGKLMLSTDKPVYQPGQTIHIRGLALRRLDLHPVAGDALTFTITDERGNMIFKKKDTTSRYGIASADCELASEVTEGDYAILADLAGSQTKTIVKVMKYVLPKFKIEVKLDEAKKYYQPGDLFAGTVQGNYFTGKPVVHGKVKLECKLRDGTATLPVEAVERETDENGKLAFDFKLPLEWKNRSMPEQCQVVLETELTDTAEQHQSSTITRPLVVQPLRLFVIPEAGKLLKGVNNVIFFHLQHPDGSPAAGVSLQLAHLINFQTSKPGNILTNSLGTAAIEVIPNTDVSWISFGVIDGTGKSLTPQQIELHCEASSHAFLVRTCKAVYQGGDTMKVHVDAFGDDPVFIEIVKDRQVVLTETIPIKDSVGTAELDLPAELAGTVQLVAHRRDNPYVIQSRTLYIRPAHQVLIHSRLDHASYKPGDKATLDFTLTDEQDHPVPGALSLSVVDEAVFSVLEQMPGMERTFFLMENDLLKPLREVYPWAPAEDPQRLEKDRDTFEQALFARTARVVPGQGGRNRQALSGVFPNYVATETYRDKSENVTKEQNRRVSVIERTWVGALLFIPLALYLLIWVTVRLQTVLIIHGFVALIALLGICVYSGIEMVGTNANDTFEGSVDHHKQAKEEAFTGFPNQGKFEKINAPFPPMASASFLASESSSASRNQPVRGKEPKDPEDATRISGDNAPVRLREDFPETLDWRPQVITDDKGEAKVELQLADSITAWRVTASAVTVDGRLGSAQPSIAVFQPLFIDLNLPVSLTRGDEVAVPVVVHNYDKATQTVHLLLKKLPWFELIGEAEQDLTLNSSEVRSVNYRIHVLKVGKQTLQITAKAAKGMDDAIVKPIEVVPDGRRVDVVSNGELRGTEELRIDLPENTIDGSGKAILKIYPSTFSQLVEGLDSIFQMPHGCFEQTSSTTYPNVLALSYLEQTRKGSSELREKAMRFIHLGYQRLIGYEVRGGGFSWFGRAPANRVLTAYGLMEFHDMAKVYTVDPAMVARTRNWLLKQRRNGAWEADGGVLHDNPTASETLSTTAYIAWAVFDGNNDGEASSTRRFLYSHAPGTINNPHTLALVCLALMAIDGNSDGALPYLDRLESLKQLAPEEKLAWWEQPQGEHTTFHGSGTAAKVETTALAALALIEGRCHPGTVNRALSWLVKQKDPSGTWYSTQATVLALKALLKAGTTPLGDDQERVIEISLGDKNLDPLKIASNQSEVMRLVDLSPQLKTGTQTLVLRYRGDAPVLYQLAFRYHVRDAAEPARDAPFQLQFDYLSKEVKVGEAITVKLKATNLRKTGSPMVMLELPIPPGFDIETDELPATVARYQVQSGKALLYLMGLKADETFAISYRLRAKLAGDVSVAAGRVYEYYDPEKQAFGAETRVKAVEEK